MDGWVDKNNGGVTELRVHGVSGTPPESMLENPHVTLVSGDATAGFYRRVWLAGPPSALPGEAGTAKDPRREAYSWGGLTSGAGSRALWMLLLPFMLANVAFWMYPAATIRPREKEPWWRSPARDVTTALQRLFALSLTVTLTLSVVNVATDLVGWQCGGSNSCVGQNSFLHFLGALAFFSQPGRRLAIASLVPVGIVGLLWMLGHKSWNAYERLQPVATPGARMGRRPVKDHLGPDIGRRRMWNGAEPVRRLRSLHVCAAFATAGIFLLAPLTSGTRGGLATAITVLLILMALALSGPVLALLVPPLWRRKDPEGGAGEATLRSPPRDHWRWLPWIALILVLLSMIVALLPGVGPATAPGPLPWLSGSVGGVFLGQIVLLFLISAVIGAAAFGSRADRDASRQVGPRRTGDGARSDAGSPNGASSETAAFETAASSPAAGQAPSGKPELRGRALAGLAAPVTLLLSWVLSVALGAGLVLRSADYLGTPAPTAGPVASHVALLVPSGYYWAAAGALCFVVVGILLAAVVFVLVWRHAANHQKDLVTTTYKSVNLRGANGRDPVNARAHQIARAWAWACMTDAAPLLLTMLASVLAMCTIAGVVGYLAAGSANGRTVHGMWLWQHASWLATAGSWAVGAAALALIALGRRAYKDPATRRSVGVLWDLGTFWPRATHPLAPPCYCERTFPDLIDRTTWLAPKESDLVILSTHSQGTVIGAALVLQLDSQQRARTALVTYGSPLQRLYCRFFPAYFGTKVLQGVGEALMETVPAAPAAPGVPAAPAAPGVPATGARHEWPWRNLYRASDPIGGPIHRRCDADESLYQPDALAQLAAGHPCPAADNGDVDRQLLDPLFSRAAGDMAYPAILGHSKYFADPYFAVCIKTVIQLAARRLNPAQERTTTQDPNDAQSTSPPPDLGDTDLRGARGRDEEPQVI